MMMSKKTIDDENFALLVAKLNEHKDRMGGNAGGHEGPSNLPQWENVIVTRT